VTGTELVWVMDPELPVTRMLFAPAVALAAALTFTVCAIPGVSATGLGETVMFALPEKARFTGLENPFVALAVMLSV
jgi:hypothetical protein